MLSYTKWDADGQPTSSAATGRNSRPRTLFALQMLNSVAMGKNPRNIDYDQGRMQDHLEECFEKEELSLFPPSSVPVKRSGLRHLFVKVYCFCKTPECTWFHFKCVGLCSSSNTDNWKCSTCCMY